MAIEKHETEDDAFATLHKARVGAHVGATDTFLVAMRANLYRWIADIDAELAARDERRARSVSVENL